MFSVEHSSHMSKFLLGYGFYICERSWIKWLSHICWFLQVFDEGSPREAEGGDDLADDVIYPEDLEIFDSDAESDVELGDNASIKSQDKPKLRCVRFHLSIFTRS